MKINRKEIKNNAHKDLRNNFIMSVLIIFIFGIIINGRVCLEGLLVFGLGGAAITYFLAPLLNSLFNKIKYKIVVIICMILLTLFGADVVYSINHPNKGKGITDYE